MFTEVFLAKDCFSLDLLLRSDNNFCFFDDVEGLSFDRSLWIGGDCRFLDGVVGLSFDLLRADGKCFLEEVKGLSFDLLL